MNRRDKLFYGKVASFLCLCLFFAWLFSSLPEENLALENLQNILPAKQGLVGKGNTIVLGMEFCSSDDAENRAKYLNQTVVFLKSLLISIKIYNVPRVEVHQILEHDEDKDIFRKKLKEMGYPAAYDDEKEGIQEALKIYTHSLKDVKHPKKFEKEMVDNARLRCAYERFYYASLLTDVDAIIHMDSDILITGSLVDIWNQFSKMTAHRTMVGAVNDIPPGNENFDYFHNFGVGEIPHLTEHGLNAGVMWMNLTKMREFGWEERFTRIYKDYSRIISRFMGQKAFNTLIYFEPDTVVVMPCHFNFGHSACSKGFSCEDAVEDPLGIQLVHGFGNMYMWNQCLYGIFEIFNNFQYDANATIEVLKRELMTPIRNWYDDTNDSAGDLARFSGQCRGTIHRVLFPNFFKD